MKIFAYAYEGDIAIIKNADSDIELWVAFSRSAPDGEVTDLLALTHAKRVGPGYTGGMSPSRGVAIEQAMRLALGSK